MATNIASILRFSENNYSVSSPLEYYVDQYFNLTNIELKYCLKSKVLNHFRNRNIPVLYYKQLLRLS